jgi:hypothetical protein
MQTALVGGTAEVYHDPPAPRELKHKSSRQRVPRIVRLYRDLAYCRVKLCQARGHRGERWVAFYREECARLRRCVEATLKPKVKPPATGDIRRQILSWCVAEVERDETW